ncbi:MAG TPA: glycosyltransferase [Enteractinococcus sp.]
MAKYHVTGIFLLEDPASTTTEVLSAALNGAVGLDAAVVVTGSSVEPAVLENLNRLMDGATYHHVVYDPEQSLATQLASVLEASQAEAQRAGIQSWLWFLTNDTVVSEHALAKQLQAVEISPSVTIAGAKHLVDRELIDVGLTVAHNGEVLSMIEPGELDQGQYDHRTDTFAVSLPGMLVRTDVFVALNGFDPHTPAAVRAVDLCWRARLAGHRVAVVPGAEVQHQAHPEAPSITDRWAAARWLRLKHTGVLSMLAGWIWGVLTAIFQVLVGLIVKDPATGVAQASGIFRTLGRVGPLLKSRRAAQTTRTRPFDAVDDLRPTRARVRDYRRSVLEISEPDRVIGDGTGVSSAPQEATGGHDDFDELATPERNWIGIGAVTLTVVFGAIALIGLRHLLGVPALAGGNLLPITQDLAVLANKAASGWALTGAGAPGYDGPFGWLLVFFGLSTNASAVTVWLWVLALPLAALGAWTLAGRITTSRYVRFAAGLLWAAAPALLIALSEGRFGGVLTHLVLPWFVLAVLRAIGYRPDDVKLFRALHNDGAVRPVRLGRKLRDGTATTSLTAAAWVAILLTVITAGAPIMFLPLTLGIVAIILILRPTLTTLWWTPLLALTALLPALVTHRGDLRAIFADPGAPAGYEPAPTWQLLLGLPHRTALDAGLAEVPWLDALSPNAPWTGIAVGIIAIPLVLCALIGLIAPGRGGGLARTGALIAAAGLAVGTLSAGIIFAIDQSGVPVPISTIPAVSLTWLGLLVAAIIGLNYLTIPKAELRTTGTSVRVRAGWPTRTATTVLVLTAVLATGLWLTPRVVPGETLAQARAEAQSQRSIAAAEAATDDHADTTAAGHEHLTGAPTVTGVLQRSLPATAVDAAVSELQTRTLVITRTSEGLRTHLISGEGTMLDDMTGTWTTRSVTGGLWNPQPAGADDADNALRTVAAQLTSGADVDPRPILDALGAGYVVLTDASGTETTLAAGIDAAPGLASVGHSSAGWLWRVTPEADQTDEALGVDVLTHDGKTAPRGTATARARIVDQGDTVAIAASEPDGSIDVQLPDGPEGRLLVIAERTNPGFRAYVDGQELTATTTDPDWVQAFELPATGGNLTMEFAPTAGKWLWLIPGLVGLVTLLLGIPTRPRRTEGR